MNFVTLHGYPFEYEFTAQSKIEKITYTLSNTSWGSSRPNASTHSLKSEGTKETVNSEGTKEIVNRVGIGEEMHTVLTCCKGSKNVLIINYVILPLPNI